ncbi:YdcF family protein [Arthrobacter terricola]|uniref:YdcF family protein n=1 Tax=Arthrobacter terricola TaxID=2547396 RepID=A0A4R5KJG0_9MICC|nr:ElyC/SanA/YdcF family protein [Arthrobacter terricola]MBT8159213.1 YdcF family protein [Arthrobacter sp. GN70]TDF94948.1 YdcF family protein [Arthrobacter terricola]
MTLIRTPEAQAAPQPPAPRRRNRLVVRWLAIAASLGFVWAIAGIFLYVEPQSDEPQRADVVFVLGPPDSRMDYAEKLMDEGYAPTLAVSSPVDKYGRFTADICGEHMSYRVICFHPEPFTTQGEARALKSMSDRYGWHSANVLTAQFHVTRARVIVERCYKDELHMVADQPQLPLVSLTQPTYSWAYQYLYQTAAFVKVAVHPEC